LLSTAEPPDAPYELAVSVQLDDESGAAGLIFHADGSDRHYGFYPSNGRLRLTRFEGPTPLTWQVLREVPSAHYRARRWNDLKVRVDKGRISCFVNDHVVIESDDGVLPPGRVGLAKFRQTAAQFKDFRIGRHVPSARPTADMIRRVERHLQALPRRDLTDGELALLAEPADTAVATLQTIVEQLTDRAAELEQLTEQVHVTKVCQRLRELAADVPEVQIDLLRAALWIACLDNSELDIEAYVDHVDRMVREIETSLAEGAGASEKLAALNKYLFSENGFHGSRNEYYHRANSYLDRVIDDREGLPITLSILYLELGRRLGLRLVGVGLPGHFVVRHEPEDGNHMLIDVFEGGRAMSRRDAELKVLQTAGVPLADDQLVTTGNRAILVRVLTNLLRLAEQKGDKRAMLRYSEAMVSLDPRSLSARGLRAVLRRDNQRYRAALQDLDWFLENETDGIDLNQIRRMREAFAEEREEH
jgi:regulator of sirC expression with transglutaminase-like and TPR domain